DRELCLRTPRCSSPEHQRHARHDCEGSGVHTRLPEVSGDRVEPPFEGPAGDEPRGILVLRWWVGPGGTGESGSIREVHRVGTKPEPARSRHRPRQQFVCHLATYVEPPTRSRTAAPPGG